MKNKRTLVSIDWDFFIPEKPEWDLGHKENAMFLNMMWHMRGHLIPHIKTSGLEKEFHKRIKHRGLVAVSDSHAFAYNPNIDKFDEIILFDAHHDCWATPEDGGIMCHNWARACLEENPKAKLTWVYPRKESLGYYPVPDDLAARVRLQDIASLEGQTDATVLHICRSGCWTPPWLDQAFIDFVKSFGNTNNILSLQDNEWDPMNIRWSEDQIKQVIRMTEVMEEQMNKLRRMYTSSC